MSGPSVMGPGSNESEGRRKHLAEDARKLWGEDARKLALAQIAHAGASRCQPASYAHMRTCIKEKEEPSAAAPESCCCFVRAARLPPGAPQLRGRRHGGPQCRRVDGVAGVAAGPARCGTIEPSHPCAQPAAAAPPCAWLAAASRAREPLRALPALFRTRPHAPVTPAPP